MLLLGFFVAVLLRTHPRLRAAGATRRRQLFLVCHAAMLHGVAKCAAPWLPQPPDNRFDRDLWKSVWQRLAVLLVAPVWGFAGSVAGFALDSEQAGTASVVAAASAHMAEPTACRCCNWAPAERCGAWSC